MTLTLSLTAGRSALKQVARNTPPPKELLNATAFLYLTALSRSDCITRTGMRMAASMKPNMPKRHRILATTISMLLIQIRSSQYFIRTVRAWLEHEQPPSDHRLGHSQSLTDQEGTEKRVTLILSPSFVFLFKTGAREDKKKAALAKYSLC